VDSKWISDGKSSPLTTNADFKLNCLDLVVVYLLPQNWGSDDHLGTKCHLPLRLASQSAGTGKGLEFIYDRDRQSSAFWNGTLDLRSGLWGNREEDFIGASILRLSHQRFWLQTWALEYIELACTDISQHSKSENKSVP